MSFAFVDAQQRAAFDFLPLLFIAYVIYAVISALVKAGRQAARQAQAQPQPPQPATQGMTADDVRAALARRVAAAAARAATAAGSAPIRPVAVVSAAPPAVAPSPIQPAAPMSIASDIPFMTLLAEPGDASSASSQADLKALLASLPLAAQAVVAAAVIGPCAAHRGGGHQPEDW